MFSRQLYSFLPVFTALSASLSHLLPMILQEIAVVFLLGRFYLLQNCPFFTILAALVQFHIFIDSKIIEFLHVTCQQLTRTLVADEGDCIDSQILV